MMNIFQKSALEMDKANRSIWAVFLSLTSCGGGCYNQDMKKHNLYRGFTIIEVVLVLAIAGLIFIMIFLGLPVL